MDKIVIKGARENNLKNVDLTIPKNTITVVTGVSGSGKSSLAFDTIYAEGERRYIESLSSYARQFLGGTKKPDVDSIEGLSPAISIDQKSTNNNPRSTLGTITEIYDYYRLLYARVGDVYCPNHNIKIAKVSIDEISSKILEMNEGTKIILLSPVIFNKKGEHKEVFNKLIKEGFTKVRVDNNYYDLDEEIELDKNKKHNIEVVIDRLVIKGGIKTRLFDSLDLALKMGSSKIIIDEIGKGDILLSTSFSCPHCNFTMPELEPLLFSFNSAYGACPKCNGIGYLQKIDPTLVVPDEDKSLRDGAIKTLGKDTETIYFKQLESLCKHYKISMTKAFKKLSKKEQELIFYGSSEIIKFNYKSKSGNEYNYKDYYEGIINELERRYVETKSEWIRDWLNGYMMDTTCDACHGDRLNTSGLSVKVNGKNIAELSRLSVSDSLKFFNKLKLSVEKEKIAGLLIKEIKDRLSFLENLGLGYLSINRYAATLSGGEAQRIRLSSQIGSKLSGVLYVLDEPSIGLHERDNDKLIESLKSMRDLGNTLIVVEHDENMMKNSDYLVDVGPLAGDAGGEIVAFGTPKEVASNINSLTGKYLSGERKIEVPKKRRKAKKYLEIKGAKENNLKNIDVKIPLSLFTVVTGVSGSGKSSLIMEILSKTLLNKINKRKVKPGLYKEIKGLENVDKIVEITQDPIGRTPRSNPATYTGVFDDIRELYSNLKDSKIRGYDKGRFSFNLRGGRCEACRGDGIKKIEMNFLPDVYVPCEVCKGKRYNSEVLEIKYHGKNIADVLDMRVSEALDFFDKQSKIVKKLEVLDKVGLSYIKLGQIAPTLSGGEASRVKLAKELQKKPTGKTVYIMDEPSTGLHAYDIEKLLNIIKDIVDHKDTVIVIEHNLDIIKSADYIIDLGPEGGDAGGHIVATGTPEDIIKVKESYTGKYLKSKLN